MVRERDRPLSPKQLVLLELGADFVLKSLTRLRLVPCRSAPPVPHGLKMFLDKLTADRLMSRRSFHRTLISRIENDEMVQASLSLVNTGIAFGDPNWKYYNVHLHVKWVRVGRFHDPLACHGQGREYGAD